MTLYAVDRSYGAGEIVIRAVPLPFDWVMDVFSHGGDIYVASWNKKEPVSLHRLVEDRVEAYSGPLVELLRAADLGADDVGWVGDEAVVTTSHDREKGLLKFRSG